MKRAKQHIGRARHHYHRLPHVAQWAIGIGAGIVVIQLLYPAGLALPFARLNGQPVSLRSTTKIEQQVSTRYSDGAIIAKVHDATDTTMLSKAGILPDTERAVRDVSSYPWYWRLVPLSLFARGALTDAKVWPRLDHERFSVYASDLAKLCLVVPKNAGAKVEGDTITLDPMNAGAECPEQSVRGQILSHSLQPEGLSLTVATSSVAPDRINDEVRPLLESANRLASRQITLQAEGKDFVVDKATLVGWLAFPEDTTGTLSVQVDPTRMTGFLDTVQKQVMIAPGTTVITMYDGLETARSIGASGRGINIDETARLLAQQTMQGSGAVAATTMVLPPTTTYNRSYSKTPEGLQVLVNDLARDNGDMAISVRKLGDRGVSAAGDKQYHPASTYKLFVAYSVLRRIDSGAMSWSTTATGGQSVSQCFDAMIVNSDNACAEWFGTTIGWNTLTSEAKTMGATGTVLSKPFVSTTSDMALLLQKLESGQLGISEPSRARLLDAMKRQVYRQGIPAGVGGSVADKVGFLDGHLHDAAIVYSPKGVYVVVIYSKGSSWQAIANVAHRINDQL